MKKLIYLFIASIFTTGVIAQSMKLETNEVLNNNILRSSVELKMTPSTKNVKKAWKNYLEDNYDADVDGYGLFKKADILSANAASLLSISDNPIDLYAKIVADGEMTKMNVFGSFGNNSYLTPFDNPLEFEGMQNLVSQFVASFLPNYFAEVVDDAQGDVKDAAKNVADLEKKIEKNKEKIKDLSKENIDLIAELATARETLSQAKKVLNQDKKKFETVKDKVSKNGSGMK